MYRSAGNRHILARVQSHLVYDRIVSIDERIEALTMNLELANRDIQDLVKASKQDGENIRALARIAEIHEHRLTHLDENRGVTPPFRA